MSGMRWFGHVEHSDGRIAQVCKRRDYVGKKTLDEVLQDGRKKLGMDLATLKTGLRVFMRKTCQKVQPLVEENGLLSGYDDVIMMK